MVIVGGLSVTDKKRRNGSVPAFHIGDRVRIPFGVSTVEATIVEDRGVIGAGGRRLYRVLADEPDHFFHLDTERAEEQIQLVSPN